LAGPGVAALVSFLSVVGPGMEFLLSRRISRPIRAVVGSVLASLMTTLMPNTYYYSESSVW